MKNWGLLHSNGLINTRFYGFIGFPTPYTFYALCMQSLITQGPVLDHKEIKRGKAALL